jgi:CRP-like cAMP-binding protein
MAVEKLKKQEIFQLLRPEQINRLSEAAEAVRFTAGETIYERGGKADHFYIVLKGQVSLRLPGNKAGLSVLIDELREGDLFGGCVSSALDAYALTAQCTEDSEVLVIGVSALKAIMEQDPRMGYVIQSRISKIYFKRYIEIMEKLQAIVMNVPVEAV